jgi:hypothetical protein
MSTDREDEHAMASDTHVTQSNGFSRGPLINSIRPYQDQLRFSLGRMNGTTFWAYSLWRAPDGADLRDDVPLSESYLQCAGSAEALTIELRQLDEEGTPHQWVVGKPGEAPSGPPTAVIRWDDGKHSTTVHPHEVFTAAEAGDVFVAYFLTDAVPAQCTLRALDVRR